MRIKIPNLTFNKRSNFNNFFFFTAVPEAIPTIEVSVTEIEKRSPNILFLPNTFNLNINCL